MAFMFESPCSPCCTNTSAIKETSPSAMMMNDSNPGSVPVARPRQRRNKPAGHSMECRGRGAAEEGG